MQSCTCQITPSGSIGGTSTLDSDLDLNIINLEQYQISDVIKLFNDIINDLFGDTSSVVFDTNLYGYSPYLKYYCTEPNPYIKKYSIII